jgi:oligoribonuclease NrnB/cAMP/cGMP phosphodiesterase (DHH superfamily)
MNQTPSPSCPVEHLVAFHSADQDGHCSGALVANHVGWAKVHLHGINYGQEFPFELVDEKTTVWMVDFSLQPFTRMLELKERCGSLIWIDHHKSAIIDYEQLSDKQKWGTTSLNPLFAGCELVWSYLYGESEAPPLAVHLIGRYDVWKWEDVKDALEFQMGLRCYDTWPCRETQGFWMNLLTYNSPIIQKIINEGETVIKYRKQQNVIHAQTASFSTMLDDLRCIAINEMFNNSQLFDSVWDPEKYDVMLTFGWRKGKWHVSLYSTKESIDVSIIAKKHGGGGHKGAAGFQCDTLPFSRIDT